MSDRREDQEPEGDPVDSLVVLRSIAEEDGRYDVCAFHFLFEALRYSQELLGRDAQSEDEEERHVTGQELCQGIRRLALSEFGLMAKAVFQEWGIYRTDDFGEMVYLLIQKRLMAKRESDSIEDFHSVYDFETAFEDAFSIEKEGKKSSERKPKT